MKIEVHHAERLESDTPSITFEHVATVSIPEIVARNGVKAALEYAWRWTNNVEGSWSRGQLMDDAMNGDWNPNVHVVKPLRTFQGQVFGHRSSMVGDRFIVDGEVYVVALMGFRKEGSDER